MFSPGDIVLCHGKERGTIIGESPNQHPQNICYLVDPECRSSPFWKKSGRCPIGKYFSFSHEYLRLVQHSSPINVVDTAGLL